MAYRKKRKKASPQPMPFKTILFSACALVLAAAIVTLLNRAMDRQPPSSSDLFGSLSSAVDAFYSGAELAPQKADLDGDVLVHFIDVGQADCELIQTAEETILIDAGEKDSGEKICAYLKAQGIERIDLLIATHPHADHIGGMAEVVNTFEIGRVLFSDVPDNLIPTTKTYERLLDAIAAKGLKISRAKPGSVYELSGGAQLTVYGPVGQDKKELNNASIVCRLSYGEKSFLFAGDAEAESETAILKKFKREIGADVLKLGHHGSSTSTQETWLARVAPSIAVACVGEGNSYSHPAPKTVKRLKEQDITLYRTDLDGTIVIATDGRDLSVSTEKQRG